MDEEVSIMFHYKSISTLMATATATAAAKEEDNNNDDNSEEEEEEYHIVPPSQQKERSIAPLQTYYAKLKVEHVQLVALQDQRKLEHGKAKQLLLALKEEVQERQHTNARLEQYCLLQQTKRKYSEAQQRLQEIQQAMNEQDDRGQQLIQAIQQAYFQSNDYNNNDSTDIVEEVKQRIQRLEEQLREWNHRGDSDNVTDSNPENPSVP